MFYFLVSGFVFDEWGLFVFVVVNVFDDFDDGEDFEELGFDVWSFLMGDVFDFEVKEHVEGIAYIFGPVVVEFEEYFSHQVHGDLIPAHWVEVVEVLEDDDEKFVNGGGLFAFYRFLDDFEKIVLIEGVG